MQNFTAADLVQTSLAILAFALFLLAPGYLIGFASNIFGMRHRSAAEKLLFSLAFSIATTPIISVLITRISSYTVTLCVFVLLALIAAGMLVRQLPVAPQLFSGIRHSTWLLLAMMAGWFLIVQLSLADWQIGNRLYINYVVYDHSVRVAFVDAAARAGVPPRNPFYDLDGSIPVLRYFYYWYVVCALPMRLFGLSAKACLDASVFWSGIALAALIPLYLKHFSGEREGLRTKSVIGIALLAVTGLDLLPYAAVVHYFHEYLPDMEWWDPNQVTSWLGSLIWVPHHVAALTACMAGLLAITTVKEESALRDRIWAAIIAGLAFASAAGLSVYVTFSFAIFMVIWSLWTLARQRIKTFATYSATGAFTLLLSKPYLSDLLSKKVDVSLTPAAGGGDRFAFFALRDFSPATLIFAKLGIHSDWLLDLSKLPILVVVYLVEFGFFAYIGFLCLARDRRSRRPLGENQRLAWTVVAVCLLAMTILKSNTTGANDLGWRGMLVVQFVLSVWAAPLTYEVCRRKSVVRQAAVSGRDSVSQSAPTTRPWPGWVKISLLCTLAIGVAGTAWQLIALRCYGPLADSGTWKREERFMGPPGFGERTYWMRQGFGRLNEMTSPNTIVQFNPVRDEVLIARLYSDRQNAMGDDGCGSAFGGDLQKCRDAFRYFAAVFNDPDTVSAWNVNQFCDKFAIPVLVATDADPVWGDPNSWVWRSPVLVSNPQMRAVRCGTGLRPD
jgi:hypothetical protein